MTATSVQIQDTIPTALGFVSSTQSNGSYDPTSGIWNIGDIGAGAADTMQVMLEVTDGTSAVVANIAVGQTLEVDMSAFGDGAVAFLTIS